VPVFSMLPRELNLFGAIGDRQKISTRKAGRRDVKGQFLDGRKALRHLCHLRYLRQIALRAYNDICEGRGARRDTRTVTNSFVA